MAEEGKVSQEVIERLITRIDSLEKKLAEKEKKDKKKKTKEKDTTKKITDATGDFFKESGKLLRGVVDASVEATKEAANALSSLSDETDKEGLGEIPAAFVSVLRRTADIQKKAIDKFEENYKKDDDD